MHPEDCECEECTEDRMQERADWLVDAEREGEFC